MPICTQCETRPGHIYDSEGSELICTECAGVNIGEAVADLARGIDLEAQKIVTASSFDAPGQFAWSATRGDYDLGALVGTGPTEQDAINDLLEQENE